VNLMMWTESMPVNRLTEPHDTLAVAAGLFFEADHIGRSRNLAPTPHMRGQIVCLDADTLGSSRDVSDLLFSWTPIVQILREATRSCTFRWPFIDASQRATVHRGHKLGAAGNLAAV
jgi:hypothetical protein